MHLISTSRPAKTSFQVDIDIYEKQIGQIEGRFLSSHITIRFIFS